MHFDKKFFLLGVLSGLIFAVAAWAITSDQIWQHVYDSTNTAIRINQVTP
jgi:hypothetical protein